MSEANQQVEGLAPPTENDDEQSRRGGWRRIFFRLLIVGLLAAGLLWACGGADEEETRVLPMGPTEAIEAGSYAPWRVGDTHVHLVGDSGVLSNNRCRPNEVRGLASVVDSLDRCAARLVQATDAIAEHNGLDWAILTEHGPWLGSPQLVQCSENVTASVLAAFERYLPQSLNCVRHASMAYSYSVSSAAWSAIRNELSPVQESGPDLLLGQEIGTAAGISVVCANASLPLLAPIAARRGPGHVGVFTLGGAELPLRNTMFDCIESTYLQDLQDGGLFGAINHPDNGDQGSDWHCWQDYDRHPSGDPCERGLASFTRGVLPIDVGDPLPSPASVAAVAIVSDTKAPRDSTIINVLWQLQQGRVLGFVGGSDSHAITRERTFEQSLANDGKIGLAARTYAFAPERPNGPTGIDPVDHPVRFALASQATTASLGPLLSVQIEGVRAGGTAALPAGDSVRMLVDWPAAPQTWPHIQVGSGGYEITEDQIVPRDNERSHLPEAIEIYVVVVGDPDCPLDCREVPEPIRIEIPADGSDPLDPRVVANSTEINDGILELDLSLPGSSERWAVVVRGDYGADIELADGRMYPVEAWSSPIWIDGSQLAAAVATDDSSWDLSGTAVSQPSTFSFPDVDYVATSLGVVNQQGIPVANATIQLYLQEGNQLIPLPARSRALAPAARYSAAFTNQAGNYEFGIAPGQYVAAAAAPFCQPGVVAPTVAFDPSAAASAPIQLACADESAIAIEYRPISNALNPPAVEVGLVCAGDGQERVVAPQFVPANTTTELARVPVGWRCTATETPPLNGRLITDAVRTELVTARGVEFVGYTTVTPQPASFAIDALPFDPSEVGESVDIALLCPGDASASEVELILGERLIVDGLFDGDTCVITYQGDRLAYPPAQIHEVDVFGQVVDATAHEGHDHAHDARFSLVELRFGRNPIEVPLVLPDLGLPEVVARPIEEPPVDGDELNKDEAEETREARQKPDEVNQTCPALFLLIGGQCTRFVTPIEVVTGSDPVCRAGWSFANNETVCERRTEIPSPPTVTSKCPDNTVPVPNSTACNRWIITVPIISGSGVPTCPDDMVPVGSGDGLKCEVIEENPPDPICEPPPAVPPEPIECVTANYCGPGWNFVATGPAAPRCSAVDPRFVAPEANDGYCPAGSVQEGDRCRLDQAIIEPVDPIIERSCTAGSELVGDDTCVAIRVERELPTAEFGTRRLTCPAGSIEIDGAGSGRCAVYETPDD